MATSIIENICSTQTIDSWNVRKFNDGRCEATKKVSKTLTSNELWTNGHYAGSFTETLPSGLFTSVDYGECQIQTFGIWGWALPTTTNVTVRYTVASSGISVTAQVLIHVVGKWK